MIAEERKDDLFSGPEWKAFWDEGFEKARKEAGVLKPSPGRASRLSLLSDYGRSGVRRRPRSVGRKPTSGVLCFLIPSVMGARRST